MSLLLRLCCSVLTLAVISCTSAKQESHADVALREVTADLGDIKHQIHNAGIDMQILEERTKNQENETDSIKTKLSEAQQQQKRLIQNNISGLEKQVANMASQRESIVSDLQNLKKSVNDLNTSLTQYQAKLQQVESGLTTNNQQTEKNINSLKSAVASLVSLVEQRPTAVSDASASGKTYRVQSGDSLERIARRNNTTVDAIKQLNSLTSDLIVVGNELRIP